MRRIYGTILILLSGLFCFGQTRLVDSMRKIIIRTKDPLTKYNAIVQLCGGGGNITSDTLYYYLKMGEQLKPQLNIDTVSARLAYLRCVYYTRISKNDSAMQLINKYIGMFKNNPDRIRFYIDFLMLRARILDRGNNYTATLNQLYDVLKLATQYNDTLNLLAAQTGIGWVQMEMEQYKESLTWFYRSLNLIDKTPFAIHYSALYSNIAAAYNKLGKNDSAEYYINRAILYGRETEMFTFLATSLNIAADIFIDTKQNDKAEAALKEAIETRKKVSDPFYVVYDMSRLANWYAHNGKTAEGIELAKKGIEQARQWGLSSQEQLMYRALAECYKVSGDNQQYSETLEKIIALKDSFSVINSSKLLIELQNDFERQKQENVIMQQKFTLARQNYLLYGSLVILLLVVGIAYLFFRDYRRRQLAKEQQLVETEKKRIAADLHDNLGAYANAVLYNTELLQLENDSGARQNLMNDLKYASKDIIISLRETIWALKKDHYTAEDCLLRIRNFIQPFTRYYPHIQFSVEGTAPVMELNGSRALHLVRMVQESVNNAIKHADARHILVKSTWDEKGWRLQVSDDGKGFSKDVVISGSEQNGLANLKERAAAANIDLQIESQSQTGTSIRLLVEREQ